MSITVIIAVAIAIIAPAVLRAPMTHDSFWIDWVWADQFTAELRRGNLYPRWLPLSHGGLGSPVFYYYPPLAFYLTGLFGLVGFTTYESVIGAFWIGLVASGVGMHAWLKDMTRSPLVGAVLYMVAPYHVYDFYGRGALAEFVAISFIPVIALGLRRAINGRFVTLALGYAGIVVCHLPLALLTSMFLILPWIIVRRESIWKIAAPVGFGIALAAIYLVPALLLEPFRDGAKLWTDPSLQPENWTLTHWYAAGPANGMRHVFAWLIVALLPLAVIAFFSRERFWFALAAVTIVVAIGGLPGFWTLPLVREVQFPFRILPIAEFAVITGLLTLRKTTPLIWIAAIPAGVLALGFVLANPKAPHMPLSHLAARHPDVPENLPPGERPYSFPSEWALDLARSRPGAVFSFPAWNVTCQGRRVETFPDPETQLLSYRGRNCERRLVWTAAEQVGAVISILAALLLLVLWRRRARHDRLPIPADPL